MGSQNLTSQNPKRVNTGYYPSPPFFRSSYHRSCFTYLYANVQHTRLTRRSPSFMKTIHTLLLLITILPSLITFHGVIADSEVIGAGTKSSGDVVGKLNEVTVTETVRKGNDGNLVKSGGGDVKGEVKESKVSDLGSDSSKVLKEAVGEVREKCDSSSNSCTDDEKTFVACLRVPGNESPELSLLIQNKGKVPLSVVISAPDLVQLEKKLIELQEKEDAEVKVSIKGVESGHSIVLTAGHGNCSLDFRDQFASRKKANDTSKSTYPSFSTRIFSIRFLFVAATLIVMVSVLMFVGIRRQYFAKKGTTYQKLDTELPVSQSSKHKPGVNEGWDDSWGDDSWDDEEAPKTPSFPVTPSFSSKGIASRKLIKENWKD